MKFRDYKSELICETLSRIVFRRFVYSDINIYNCSLRADCRFYQDI